MSNVSIDDLLTKKLLLRPYLVETDIHPFVKRTTFARVWANKVKSRLGRTFVWFASLDDWIERKQAAGRPKDKEDLRFLCRLRQRNVKHRDGLR